MVKNVLKKYLIKRPTVELAELCFVFYGKYNRVELCDALSELEKEGYVTKRVIKPSKTLRPCYEYTLIKEIKEESLWKSLKDFFSRIKGVIK